MTQQLYKIRSGTRLACSYMWGREAFEAWQAEMKNEIERGFGSQRAMIQATPQDPQYPASSRFSWGDRP